MKPNQIIQCAVLAALLAGAAPRSAFAGLKINTVFIGGTPPEGSLIAGGGNLQEIFQVAAQKWERIFKNGGGNWQITIEYGWTNLPDASQFAKEFFLAEGGKPVRVTHSRVLFNNRPPTEPGTVGVFADATPRDNSKFLRYTLDRADIEGGQINVGRVFSEGPDESAERIDLLSIAVHEIGHSLGIDEDYSGFRDQLVQGFFIQITRPRPFAGYLLALRLGTRDHIEGFNGTPVITSAPTPGWRQLISGIDALLVAQANHFDRPSLGEPIDALLSRSSNKARGDQTGRK